MSSSAAAVQTGVAAFRERPFMVDTEGEPMVVARAPHLSEDVVGVDRFLHLAVPAAKEGLAGLNADDKRPLFTLIPSSWAFRRPRPGLPDRSRGASREATPGGALRRIANLGRGADSFGTLVGTHGLGNWM